VPYKTDTTPTTGCEVADDEVLFGRVGRIYHVVSAVRTGSDERSGAYAPQDIERSSEDSTDTSYLAACGGYQWQGSSYIGCCCECGHLPARALWIAGRIVCARYRYTLARSFSVEKEATRPKPASAVDVA
jgi:hypothetical protein